MLASVLVASVLATFAHAQSATSTQSQLMPPQATAAFNPGNVSSTDAGQWCLAQRNTCPEICSQKAGIYAATNLCDPVAFTYSCICSNGTEPDVTRYQQTLPYYICLATFSQCTNINAGNLQGLNNCKSNEQCGSLNASALEPAVGGSSSSSALASVGTATSAATSPVVSQGTAGTASKTAAAGSQTATAASSSAAAATSSGAAVAHIPQLATGTFAAILFAAFKFVL